MDKQTLNQAIDFLLRLFAIAALVASAMAKDMGWSTKFLIYSIVFQLFIIERKIKP